MPSSKRRTTRPNSSHPQPAPTQSDYDTDAANATDAATAAVMSAAAPPPMRTNTELNLSVLRRYRPDIAAIISIAPFAVVYQFSPDTQAWEKIGVEGTAFICQVVGYAQYILIILNRKGLDNFVIDLGTVSAEDIEITTEYIIVPVLGADTTPVVYGLWVFSDESDDSGLTSTRDDVARMIVECARQAENGKNAEEQVAEYNLDGEAESDAGHLESSEMATPTGQQIDLTKLFGVAPSQPGSNMLQPDFNPQYGYQLQTPPSQHHFASDTGYYQTQQASHPGYSQYNPHEVSLLGLLQGGAPR